MNDISNLNTPAMNGTGNGRPQDSLVKFLIFVLVVVMAVVITSLCSSCATSRTEKTLIHKEKDSESLFVSSDSIVSKDRGDVSRVADSVRSECSVQDSVHVSEVTREVITIYIDTTGKEVNRCTSVFCDRQTDRYHNSASNVSSNHVEVDSLRDLTNVQSRRLKELEHSQSVIDSLTQTKTVEKSSGTSWKAAIVHWGLLIFFLVMIYLYIIRKRN